MGSTGEVMGKTPGVVDRLHRKSRGTLECCAKRRITQVEAGERATYISKYLRRAEMTRKKLRGDVQDREDVLDCVR
jgi:hypothetical protein